jgi:hypothetical protein
MMAFVKACTIWSVLEMLLSEDAVAASVDGNISNLAEVMAKLYTLFVNLGK